MQIQDYYTFRANGLNDSLSAEQKNAIANIQQKLTAIDNEIAFKENQLSRLNMLSKVSFLTANGNIYCRSGLALDADYDVLDLFKIFQSTPERKLWFTNNTKKLCIIESSNVKDSQLYLNICIDVKGKNTRTKLTLNRFLFLVEAGDFFITNKAFREEYLKPLPESWKIKHIYSVLTELKQRKQNLLNSPTYLEYQNMYTSKKKELTKDAQLLRNAETREVTAATPILKKQKTFDKKLTDVKTIWNSTMTDAEKAELIGWFARHIKNMKIKVVDKGVSDKVISKAYPDEMYGEKYREKANSSGWDAASGTILVDSTEDAPVELIKKLSTIKHMQRTKNGGETVFKGNTINNLDLVLFLLSKYNKYGFKTGSDIRIDVKRLVEAEFKNNDTEFAQGYGGF